jgi:uncharacterized membrane protein
MNVNIDPIWSWPWWLSLAVLLTALTVWTYAGVEKSSPRRLLAVLALRLGALLLAFAMVLRPSVTLDEDPEPASTLLILLDVSKSMSIQDMGDRSRWEKALDLLRSNRDLLRDLEADRRVKVLYYKGAEGATPFDPFGSPGEAAGRRTDIGQWLHSLYQDHGRDPNLRALVLISDGADNGTRFPPGLEARQWLRSACPIHTFLVGTKNLIPKQQDLAFVPDSITVDPSPVPVKNRLTVRARLNVNGYVNPRVTYRLFLDNDSRAVAVATRTLETENDNPKTYDIELSCDAPPKPRELKVTLKVDPLPGEVIKDNNEITTYVTVTKEGLSVLYVEGTLRWEARFLRDALSGQRGLRLYKAFRLQDEPLKGPEADWFQFDKKHYDVIIIGDISAKRFSGGNPKVLETIKELVGKEGTGLLMLGGFESFGNSDWQTFGKPENGLTPIAEILPVQLNRSGSVPDTEKVKMVPTPAGLAHYVLRLDSDRTKNEALWARMPPLEGMTLLGEPNNGTVLAVRAGTNEPILVGRQYGRGRTLAFACDSTWSSWRRTPEMVQLHRRFWRQVVVWLAQQENVSDTVWVKPDVRRVALGNKLGLGVGVRGKDDQKVKDGSFLVKVIGPDGKTEMVVATSGESVREQRGTFWKTDAPGEYRIEASLVGTDQKPVPGKTATARFLVYQDDVEFWRPAANPDVLAKIAKESGGKLHRATEKRSIDEEFTAFLEDLPSKPRPQGSGRRKVWPDWEEKPPSRDVDDQIETLWTSGVLLCFVLFVTLVCLEWFLRRQWGLV